MKWGRNIYKLIEKDGLSDIDKFSTEALVLCKENICELLSLIASKLNEDFREDKAFRKGKCLTLKEKNRARCFLTEVGQVKLKRDYYYDKPNNDYVYPLDLMLNIPPYERVSSNVSASLVSQAADVSYEKSAEIVTKGEVSRQTVKNKLMAVGKLEKAAPKEKKTVKELHVFADEDHVALQNGKNRMVPLITVSEGIKAVSKGRNALINPIHFTGTVKDTKGAWENAAGYIFKAYDEDKIDKIYLHGDGAPWIKKGIEELPNCEYVMDGFHFEKHLKCATAAFNKQNFQFRIRQAIRSKDKDRVIDLIDEMLSLSEGLKQKKRIKEFLIYILNNWDGIVLRYTKNISGSCTEGLVSHVYSERLSRNPMGWSDAGLNKMAELRVYTRNGCSVTGEAFKRTAHEKELSILREYGKERLQDAVSGCLDFSIFEKEQYNPAVNTATQILIRSYGRQHSLVG